MIDIDFLRKKDCVCLVINGHSDICEQGTNTVCAAVSGIFFSLLGYLASCGGDRDVKINSVAPGYANIECGYKQIEAMRMACIGFIQISESYPDTVSVHNEVWNSNIRYGTDMKTTVI